MSSKQRMSTVSAPSDKADNENKDEIEWAKPDFIYGGPFIKVENPSPFLDTATPINIQLQGTFRRSYAYYSLKERLPIILTKIIDFLAREGGSKGSGDDVQSYIKFITKLKSDLITNKKYDPFTHITPETEKWNLWISNLDNSHYFTNTWVFTECYVYRKLREGCEMRSSLKDFDPFQHQKKTAMENSVELMCLVADKLVTMLEPSEKDKRKADFITLLKICLWSNKCDLSLSAGSQVNLNPNAVTKKDEDKSDKKTGNEPAPANPSTDLFDPFQMIIDLKDKILVDDSGKAADQVVAKAEAMAKAISATQATQAENSSDPPKDSKDSKAEVPKAPKAAPADTTSPTEGEGGTEEAPPPEIPCPAKITVPSTPMFDIVCDNAGYELFADLCFAHFLISQEIVKKIRFHVKKMPWFVSDAMKTDFKSLLDMCKQASFKREVPVEPKPAPPEGEPAPEPEPPRVITSDNLRKVAEDWQKFYDDGIFLVTDEDFWTYPHVYKDMKTVDYQMYRKLQTAVAIMFKGDLNYRKLLGERNCNPVLGFEPALQGFIPAPIIAVRTVKAELICGLPKGKWDQLNKLDEKWMQTGDYGVIHFCAKGEALKVADRPCVDYGDTCFSGVCPIHNDL